MKQSPPSARAVFDVANEITSHAERQAYLDEACAGNPDLRAEVERLLESSRRMGPFLEKPAVAAPAPATPAHSHGLPATTGDESTAVYLPGGESPGAWVGPYRLVKLLGEGGMGSVYLAEQEAPIRRQVALKIIKPGMDSAQVVARFQAERQALSLMDHPNIARVFDAGATEKGLPYFVMELVDGVPFSKFCDENRLPLRERLGLFATVCLAVQHAHGKGVIHRDLKPTNVLVARKDGAAVPKVIDFGLAKATEQPLTDQSVATQFGAVVGTPEYMSPEQASFDSPGVDTRTDVYSLGVMLYELLTGTTPIDRAGKPVADLVELLRRVREEEPPRASARVASLGKRAAKVAEARRAEPARLARALRGELDWIALKALEKPRERRYETASGLAQDVRRYLDDLPVEARPPSWGYQLGKFARKNRVASAFVGLLAVSVVGLVVGVALLDAETKRARKAEGDAFNAFLTTEAMVDGLIDSKRKLTNFELALLSNLAKEYTKLLGEFGVNPTAKETAARVQFTLARIQLMLGRKDEAIASYEAAIPGIEGLAARRGGKVNYPLTLVRCHSNLARLYADKAKAIGAYRRVIELLDRLAEEEPDNLVYRRDLLDASTDLAVKYREWDDLASAEQAMGGAARHAERLGQDLTSLDTRLGLSRWHQTFGNLLRDRRKVEASLEQYGKAERLLSPIKEPRADVTGLLQATYWDRANALGMLGRHQEASEDWRRAIGQPADEKTRRWLTQFLAASRAEEKVAAQSKPGGQALYDAAVANAAAAAAAEEAEEKDQRKRYADRGVEMLRLAGAAGFFRDPARVRRLREDRVFEALPQGFFKPFLDGLEAAAGVGK